MIWLRDILIIIAKKLNSWQSYTIMLFIVAGGIYLYHYKLETDRLARVPSEPNKEYVENTKPKLAGIGIIKEDNSELKSAK